MAGLEALYLVYAGVIGAAVGSFLHLCVVRLPRGEGVVAGRSRCPHCADRIAWYDNVPLLSWLWLRGRCRSCGERISTLYPLVELGTAGVWVGTAALHGPGWEALRGAVLLSLLLALAVSDAREYLIPDALSLGGLAAGLALSLLPGAPGVAAAAGGAAVGYLVLWVVGRAGEWAFRRPAMGGGDMKMMAMVGAFLGPVGALLTIFLGAAAGALVFGPVSLRTGRLVPFGVFLALGGAIAYLAGDALMAWYLGLV